MKKNLPSKVQDERQLEESNNDGLIAVFLIVLSIVMFPVLLSNLISPYLAEFPRVWVLAKKLRARINLLATISLIIYVFSIVPVIKFSIAHGTVLKILSVIFLWILSTPLALVVLRYRLREISTKVRQNDFDPRKIGYIRTALETAGFLEVSNDYVNEQLPIKTKNGNGVIGRIVNFDFRGDTVKILTSHRNPNLVSVEDGKFAILPLNATSPNHSLVLAETGAGKTVLLSRMALAALSSDWRVVILDFKGAPAEANLYCSLPKLVKKNPRAFAFPQQPIDLFWGTSSQVAQRLIKFLPPMPQGAGNYYWARQSTAISAVIERTSPNVGKPTSIPEVLNRIRNAGQFAVDVDDRNMLLAKENGRLVCEDIAGVLASYFGFLRTGSGSQRQGFSFESDFDLAFYSFNGMDVNEVSLGATIISDFAFWIGSEQRRNGDNRPVLFVIDEASTLQVVNGSPSLVHLFQKARSSGVSVVVASQTLSSLGDSGKELLSSGCIRYFGRMTMPNDAVEGSGTVSHTERAYQYVSQDGFTGTETIREQRTFTVNPDLVRRLPDLSWIVSAKGVKSQFYCPWINLEN